MSVNKKYSKKVVGYSSMDDRDSLNIVHSVREGVPYYGFNSITENTPFSAEEWASYLHVSERTLQRYKKEKRKFDTLQSERIIQVIQLYYFGTEVFGSEDKFDTWLAAESVALGNIVPKTLLDSSFGISILKDELGRIDHGILA